jgi:hypothetical protein
MAFEQLTIRQLLDRELELTGVMITSSAEIKTEIKSPVEVDYTFEIDSQYTPKGKKFPYHKYTVKLKSPDDLDKAWDGLVDSFKRRFNKRRVFEDEHGKRMSRKKFNERAASGVTTDTSFLVDRWTNREWTEILTRLTPTATDVRAIKQLTFADVKKIEDLKGRIRQATNERNRIQHEIRARELLKQRLEKVEKELKPEEGDLRKEPKRNIIAKTGLRWTDMNYVDRFKRGEINLDEIIERVKTYKRID